jgi:hypothetical protein
MIYENTYNINEAFNRNGQSATFCVRFLRISHKTTFCCLIKDYHIKTINIMVQAATLFTLGIAIICRSTVVVKESNATRFRLTFFGTSPDVCARIWLLIDPYATMPTGVQLFHLLWALMFS